MAAGAAEVVEACRPGDHVGVLVLAHGRHRQRLVVEHDPPEGLFGHLRAAAVGGGQALGVARVAVFVGVQRRGDPHVAEEGCGHLPFDGADVGLPAETAHHRFAGAGVGHDVDPSGDAVAVGVVRVGGRPQRLLGDRFEQPGPHHLGRQPRGDLHIVGQRTLRQVGDRDVGPAELVVAVVEAVGLGDPVDRHLALGLDAPDRPVLQLVAVGGLGHGAAVGPGTRHRQPQQQPQG